MSGKYTPTEASIELGRVIKARREAFGLSQDILAARASAYLTEPIKGITVLRIEKGTRATTIDEFIALTKVLELSGPRFESHTSEDTTLTVGDLSAAMIGNTKVRVTHEDFTVEGDLVDIRVEVDRERVWSGGRMYQIITVRSVELQIGSVTLADLPLQTPVEVLA